MARIRSIKPEFWTSEQVAECSTNARLLFIGMWNFCDDAGIHKASHMRLKMQVFPADAFSNDDISAMIDELVSAGLLCEFENSQQNYWVVRGWHHQKIDKPSYKYPKPFDEDSTIVRGTFGERSPAEGKGEEGIGIDRKKPIPKNFGISDRVRKWAKEKGFGQLEKHLEHFVGVSKAKGYSYSDWDQAFMNAIRNDWAKLGKGDPDPAAGAI